MAVCSRCRPDWLGLGSNQWCCDECLRCASVRPPQAGRDLNGVQRRKPQRHGVHAVVGAADRTVRPPCRRRVDRRGGLARSPAHDAPGRVRAEAVRPGRSDSASVLVACISLRRDWCRRCTQSCHRLRRDRTRAARHAAADLDGPKDPAAVNFAVQIAGGAPLLAAGDAPMLLLLGGALFGFGGATRHQCRR